MNQHSSASHLDSPFPGLRPFEKHEADIFFGRYEQVSTMLQRLESRRFLAVVGASGCGKSSLVRAGLLPALEEGFLFGTGSEWRMAIMRPGDDPYRELAHAMSESLMTSHTNDTLDRQAFIHATLRSGDHGLIRAVNDAALPSGTSVLVVVDQFEELFRYRYERRSEQQDNAESARSQYEKRNEANAFVNLLLETVALQVPWKLETSKEQSRIEKTNRLMPICPIFIVLTMRSDFLGDCNAFFGLPEAISDSQLLTPRLTRDQAREAIEGPVKLFGGSVEPGLVNQILNEMSNDPDELPLMQHALMRVWKQAQIHGKPVTMKIADYEAVGRIKEALSRHADEVIREIVDKELGTSIAETNAWVVEQLFRRLSERTPQGLLTRRLAKVAEVAAVANVPEETVISIVEFLQRPDVHFLVTTPPGVIRGESTIDIRHECLLRQWETLRPWIQTETESAAMFLRLLDQTRREGLGVGGLWGPPDLNSALEWRDTHKPTAAWAARYTGLNKWVDIESTWAACMDFLEKSRSAHPTYATKQERTYEVHEGIAARHGGAEVSPVPRLQLAGSKTLEVHLIWHPNRARGHEFAQVLYRQLCSDPDSPTARRLGVPVRFWNTLLGESDLEQWPRQADRSAAIIFMDDEMAVDPAWGEFVSRLRRTYQEAGERHQIYPVSLTRPAQHLFPDIRYRNFIRLPDIAESRQMPVLLNTVTFELWRLLLHQPLPSEAASSPTRGARVSVYLSYAKYDGEELARSIMNYLPLSNLDLSWVDISDIPPDSTEWRDVLRGNLLERLLVILQTDAYATREWCRREALEAKQYWIPTVVVNALTRGELQGFPYLGNLPVVRWPTVGNDTDCWHEVFGLLWREGFRSAYFARHVRRLERLYGWTNVQPIPYPPELVTALMMRPGKGQAKTYVYPDPPLSSNESQLIHELDPGIDVATPIMLVGGRASTARRTLAVGISISEPPQSDLSACGLGPMHLTHAFVEVARYLLALGHTLAYGGYPRLGGTGDYASLLWNLARTYALENNLGRERIRYYLASPISKLLTNDERARMIYEAHLIDVSAPDDVAQHPKLQSVCPSNPLPYTSAEDNKLWARCLMAMRRHMNDEIDARILLGGRKTGFVGRYPGLLEEAHMAIKSTKPLFLLGGFGGITADIIDALRGGSPQSLTAEFHTSADSMFATLTQEAPRLFVPPDDFATVRSDFQLAGVSGLYNGLTESENECLFTSTDIDEIIGLIIKGLSAFQ
jgi:energy-coupling factor transporter ATP-binding protein EcfA2